MKSPLKCHRQSPRDFALKCNLWSYFWKFVYIRASFPAHLWDALIWKLVGYLSSLLCSQCGAHNSSSLQRQPATGIAGFNPDAVCHSPSASLQNSLQNSKLKTSHQFYYEGKGKYFHTCCKIYLTFTFSALWKYHRATNCPQSAGAAKVQTQVGSLDFIASEQNLLLERISAL